MALLSVALIGHPLEAKLSLVVIRKVQHIGSFTLLIPMEAANLKN